MLYTGPFEYVLKAPEAEGPAVASAGLAANMLVALGWVAMLVGWGWPRRCCFAGRGGAAVLSGALEPFGGGGRLGRGLLLRGQKVRRYYAITVATEIGAGLGAAAAGRVGAVGAGRASLCAAADLHCRLPDGADPADLPRADPERRARCWPGRGAAMARLSGFLANYSGDLLLGAVFSPAAWGSIARATGW
jgi:hypothetical protein